MTVKSEDVRPQKRATTKTTSSKADINMETVDPKAQMVDAIKAYEGALKDASGGKIWLKMERENASFTSEKGVRFTRENPYQLVDEDEVDTLLRQNFRKAYPDEIKEFYNL